MSFWVSTEVLLSRDAEDAALKVERFVKLGLKLEALCNLSGVMEVVSGLTNGCVRRLKRAWGLVSQKRKEALESLEALVDPRCNYRGYRQSMEALGNAHRRPRVPCLSVLLRDVTFAHEGNATLDERGGLNVNKLEMLLGLTRTLRRYQDDCQEFSEERGSGSWDSQSSRSSAQRIAIRRALESLPHIKETDAMVRLSLILEPSTDSPLLGTSPSQSIEKDPVGGREDPRRGERYASDGTTWTFPSEAHHPGRGAAPTWTGRGSGGYYPPRGETRSLPLQPLAATRTMGTRAKGQGSVDRSSSSQREGLDPHPRMRKRRGRGRTTDKRKMRRS